MNRVLIETLVRNLVRIVGTAIATKGYASDGDVEFWGGLVVVVSGEAWSFYEKHKRLSDGTQPPTKPPEATKE